MKLFKKHISLTAFCLVLSLYTLVAFHAPFYRHLVSVIEPGWNGSFIVASMVLLMVAGNFFAYYLILSLGRFVGKCILAFTLVGDAIMLYFVRNFNVLVTDDMMGNVFNTQYSEASGFFSWALVTTTGRRKPWDASASPSARWSCWYSATSPTGPGWTGTLPSWAACSCRGPIP